MVAHSEKTQRIARLTPLSDILAMIDALARPVAARSVEARWAHGLTLAEDVRAGSVQPPAALALRDGWAVAAADTLDASAGAPAPLTQPQWRETGAPMPPGADAIAPADAVACRGNLAEALAPVTPGDGVLASGGDARADTILQHSGTRLRHSDIAVLKAAGIKDVSVRVPGVALVLGGPKNAHLDAAMEFLAGVIAESGCAPKYFALDEAVRDLRADAIFVLGGTGTGRRDESVHALARGGRVAAHGIAISPGETAAFGEASGRPVLMIPGRIDCVISLWLLLGKPLCSRARSPRRSVLPK
jgi:molybdopterin biosynthesis enzyme